MEEAHHGGGGVKPLAASTVLRGLSGCGWRWELSAVPAAMPGDGRHASLIQ